MDEEATHYDRLLYRLVMTNDDKFEPAVHEHLPDLLDRLTTAQSDASRQKVCTA
jgi:hypothetical protein